MTAEAEYPQNRPLVQGAERFAEFRPGGDPGQLRRIGVGVGKLGLKQRPKETRKKQAVAAVGQCELMFVYDKLFGEYNRTVARFF